MIHVLDDAKAKRLGGRTMVVPSAEAVREAIAAIPRGETRTLKALRTELARTAGAEVACPYATRVGWYLVAESGDDVPWWRVTRDGKADARLPGGAERQRELLAEEGFRK